MRTLIAFSALFLASPALADVHYSSHTPFGNVMSTLHVDEGVATSPPIQSVGHSDVPNDNPCRGFRYLSGPHTGECVGR